MYFAGKIAFHNLFNAPARTTLTCLAIITAATMVAWTVASYDGMLTENEPKRAQKMLGKYDFVVLSTATLTETDFQEQLTAITELAEVDFFQAIRVNVRTVAAPDQPLIAPPPLQGLPRRTYQVLGTSAASAPLAVQAGGWLGSDPANAATSCVLTLSLSQQLNVTVGDSLAVGSFAGSFVLQVIGILADAGASDRQTQELWGRVAAGFSPPTLGGLFVRPTAAARIAGGRPAPQFAAGTLKPGQANAEVLNRLSAKPVLGVTCEMLSSAAQAGKTVDSRVKMQSWTACSIALLLSFFIIFSSLSMGVEERSRQCGLLRAVALSRWQVCQCILLESLFLGIVGWVGGLLAGSALLEFFSEAEILRNPLARGAAPSRAIAGWTIALTGICALLGSLAAAVVPAWRASRLQVLPALSPLRSAPISRLSVKFTFLGLLLPLINVAIILLPGLPEMTRVKLYGFVGCPLTVIGFAVLSPGFLRLCQRLLGGLIARLLGLPEAFLRAQLEANLWRGVGTCLALSLGLGFYMMVVIWSASLLQPFLPGEWLPEMFVSIMPGGLNTEDLDKVRQIPGLKADQCHPVMIEQVALAEDLTSSNVRQNVVRQNNITLLGVATEAIFAPSPLLNFTFLSNRQAAEEKFRRGGNYCLVPSFFSALTGLQTGDVFQVIPPGKCEQRVEYSIAGVIRLNGWHWFSKYSGSRRNFARTAAMVFAPADSVASNFNLWRHNYYWFRPTADGTEKSLHQSFQALAVANRGQKFPVIGGGEGGVGQESIQIISKSFLSESILQRTDTIVSGMLRMPKLLLWIMSLAVANTALASIRVRRREMGIMRAVGLSGGGLLRLLLGEAIVIGLSATLLSLTYGIFSGLCSAQMATHLTFFGGMGWNFALPWASIAYGLVLTMSICLVAALVPAIIARYTSPLTLLKDQ